MVEGEHTRTHEQQLTGYRIPSLCPYRVARSALRFIIIHILLCAKMCRTCDVPIGAIHSSKHPSLQHKHSAPSQTMREFKHLNKHAKRRWSRRGGASARPHHSVSNTNSHKLPTTSILDRRRYWLQILVVVTVVLPTTLYWAIFFNLQLYFRLVPEDFGESHHVSVKAKKHTVFYNIYVSPSDPALISAGSEIVREQLVQIATSYAATGVRGNRTDNPKAHEGPLEVYYVTIGNAEIHRTVVNSTCEKHSLKCIHLEHYAAADEEKALTALYQFCQDKESRREEHSVVYVHSKGTFHPSVLGEKYHGQDPWRRAGTAAATSDLCLQSLASPESSPPNNLTTAAKSCNACGLLFQPLPALHFPGNFFSAKCSYITQLLAPANFSVVANSEIRDYRIAMRKARTYSSRLFPWGPPTVGYERYVSERKLPPEANSLLSSMLPFPIFILSEL
jgi:hypothetical protein